MRTTKPTLVAYASLAAFCMQCACGTALGEDAKKPYYTEPPLYNMRPNPDQEETVLGSVGVSGLLIKFRKGVVTTVDRTLTNSPADGKFTSGQIISGVNGVKFTGRNPVVILGEALTTAEATDGALVFDVKDTAQAPEKQVKISILAITPGTTAITALHARNTICAPATRTCCRSCSTIATTRHCDRISDAAGPTGDLFRGPGTLPGAC